MKSEMENVYKEKLKKKKKIILPTYDIVMYLLIISNKKFHI